MEYEYLTNYMGTTIHKKILKLNILAVFQSDRKIMANDRFIGPLIRLANKGHKVRLISEGLIDPTSFLTYHTVKKFAFPFFPSLPFLIQSFFIALSTAKKYHINIFLVYREEDLLAGLFVKKVSNCQLVYYAHGDSITVQQLVSESLINKIKVCVMILFEKILLPHVDLIIAVSKDTKLRIQRRCRLDSNKFAVVYNNVLPPLLSSRPLQSFKKDKKIVGYVGHFSNLKGVENLLYAFSLVSKSVENVLLVLVGDGPIRGRLENIVTQLGLQEQVIFTGWVTNALNYIRDFDVLVVPSLYEGCPSVILEAFSLNVPVLASKVGGIPELLDNDDLMFRAMDQDELASKLKMFLTSNEKYVCLKNIIKDRKKVFTFDHTSLIEQLFLQLSNKTLLTYQKALNKA
jgi:glycosyltransferase involved in cell wall biosynthesis